MLEFYEPGAAIIEDSVANTVARVTKANKRALNFMFGAQKTMLEELVFAGNEVLDRARTETHLFSEFASKMAGSAFGQGPQDDVRGMRPASDRFYPSRQ